MVFDNASLADFNDVFSPLATTVDGVATHQYASGYLVRNGDTVRVDVNMASGSPVTINMTTFIGSSFSTITVRR